MPPDTVPALDAADLALRLEAAFERRRSVDSTLAAHDVRFGPFHLRLELFGAAAATTLARPFPRWEGAPDAVPDLTIRAWDDGPGAVGRPHPPHAVSPPNPVDAAADPRFDGLVEPFWRLALDRERRLAWMHAPDLAALPAWSLAHPFLKILHPWLRGSPIQIVHAGAVGHGGRGVLIVGKSGSGKSTLSLAAQALGMDYLGDDYVAVRRPPAPRAYALYRIAKLVPQHLAARLPSFAANALRANDDTLPEAERLALADLGKAQLLVEPTRLPDGFEVTALVLPVVTGGPGSTLTPLGPGRALLALAPSTMLQLGGAAAFADLTALARAIPAFTVTLGDDLDAAVAHLRTLASGALSS